MSKHIDNSRRHFLYGAALVLAIAPLAFGRAAHAQGAPGKTALASLKQINAGVLDVGYAEDGPPDRPPVLLLHGWPYDIHALVARPLPLAADSRISTVAVAPATSALRSSARSSAIRTGTRWANRTQLKVGLTLARSVEPLLHVTSVRDRSCVLLRLILSELSGSGRMTSVFPAC